MQTLETCLTMVHIVVALAIVAVQDADGVHLLDLVIFLPDVDVFRDGLACTVQDPLQIVKLSRQLYFHDDEVPLAVLGLDVDTVELVLSGILVALALQQFDYMDLFVQKHGDKPFENVKVRLVAEHMLHRPVKPDVCVVLFHSLDVFYPPQR